MIEIGIYRKGELLAYVKPGEGSNQSKAIMGDNIVSLSFELNQIVDFKIGDYTTVYGEVYTIATSPIVQKKSQYNYLYSITFLSSQYSLARAQMMFYDSQNELKESDFSLTGTANDFIDLLIKNVNRVSTGWSKGGVIPTGTKTLSFSKADCAFALGQIADAFETEFSIKGKTVHLAKAQNKTPYRFRYGNNKGLYTITRKQVENTSVITRLYAFGGDKNLPPDYPSSRLRLPGGYTFLVHNISWTIEPGDTIQGGPTLSTVATATITFDFPSNPAVNKITFESRVKGNTSTAKWDATASPFKFLLYRNEINEVRAISKDSTGNTLAVTPFFEINGAENNIPTNPIFNSDKALPFLEKNHELYGVVEANYINEDIYPHRTGNVSAVDAVNIYRFSDFSLDFDINSHLLPGMSAKVTFNTGQLAGYTFEISKYDAAIKQFTVLRNKDEKALELPSALMRPAIGDEYVLTDIQMPISYVHAAEQLLQTRAQDYLNLYSAPVFQYSVECDPKYFRSKMIALDLGDVVWLQDNELQIEKATRVIAMSKSLIDEYQYEIELGDVIPVGTLQSIIHNQYQNSQGLTSVSSQVNNNALLNGYLIAPETSDTTGMKQVYVDADGKLWKA